MKIVEEIILSGNLFCIVHFLDFKFPQHHDFVGVRTCVSVCVSDVCFGSGKAPCGVDGPGPGRTEGSTGREVDVNVRRRRLVYRLVWTCKCEIVHHGEDPFGNSLLVRGSVVGLGIGP